MGIFLKALRAIALHALVICGGCSAGKDATPTDRLSVAQIATDDPKLVAASQPNEPERRKPIARVLGKDVFEEDLVPPARTETRDETELTRYRRDTLHSLIWQPLMDSYCRGHHIQATDEEVAQYKKTMDHEITSVYGHDFLEWNRKRLEAVDLSESDRRFTLEVIRVLEADGPETADDRMLRFYKSQLTSMDLTEDDRRDCAELVNMIEAQQAIPAAKVRWWKFDRALHAQYGGVVIFQQSNPCEPVGAYRKWLEEREQAGDFEILDDEARAAFWEYFKRDWDGEIWVVRDADPLAQPWWLKRSEEDAGVARAGAALKTFCVVGIMSDGDRDVVATGLTSEMAEATAEFVVRKKLRDEAVVEPDSN